MAKELSEALQDFLRHRFDDEMEREKWERDHPEDDDDLEEIEEREYWHNVLSDELRRQK